MQAAGLADAEGKDIGWRSWGCVRGAGMRRNQFEWGTVRASLGLLQSELSAVALGTAWTRGLDLKSKAAFLIL